MESRVLLHLSNSDIARISQIWPPQVFTKKTSLFYCGQVPVLGFLLVSGDFIWQQKNKRKQNLIAPPALVGLIDLMNFAPSPATLTVFPQSKICLVDKPHFQKHMLLQSDIGHQVSKLLIS